MNDNLRRVTVTKTPVYQSDAGAGEYDFTLNRYYQGKDLSLLTAYLKISFQDESTDKILLSDVCVTEDSLTVKFTVSEAFSRVAGKAECQLSFESTDGEVVINTEVFTVDILSSIEVESYGQTILPSAIRLLQIKLQKTLEELNCRIDLLNAAFKIKKVRVSASNFTNGEQTLSLPELSEGGVVTFSVIDGANACHDAGVYISEQDEGTVTLKYLTAPTGDFTLRFFIANPVPTPSADETD